MYIVEFVYNGTIESEDYDNLMMAIAFIKGNKLENNHNIIFVEVK